ncbi:hypothetical protein F5146DRAFT_1228744 [Armillaria mellea]|nr:hypothetical protein F5146DRAFT_1228744 [Armillaria mellea]
MAVRLSPAIFGAILLTLNLFQRRQPPNPPLEHKCSYAEDGERCKWSFDRRFDCNRHERRHLTGIAREEILHRCPLGGACRHRFKTLQLGNLRAHIRNVHEDMRDLICQVCRPFVLATDSEDLARHQAEQHSGQLPAPQHRTVGDATLPPTPVSSPPAVPSSSTSERITPSNAPSLLV